MSHLYYGVHAVGSALACGRTLTRCWVSLGSTASPLLSKLLPTLTAQASRHKAPVIRAEREHLDSLSKNGLHQGVCAEFTPLPPLRDLEVSLPPGSITPLHPQTPPQPPLLVTFDGVTDMSNIGAILRSGLLLGVDGVVLPKNSPPLDARLAKTSAGASEVWLRLGRVHGASGGFPTWLRSAGEAGWRVLGATLPGPGVPARPHIPLPLLRRDAPTILVLGSEGVGLRGSVMHACTHFTSVGMVGLPTIAAALPGDAVGVVDSLNVSVAAALIFQALGHGQGTPPQPTLE
jgi:tRNA G18 (ribose-2'-O)-methylase SpoU